MRRLLRTLPLATALLVSSLAPNASAKPTDSSFVAKDKEKPTVASLTARRDALVKVRDDLRALAARPAPDKLTPDQAKARAKFIAKVGDTADAADALAKKLTTGLAEKKPNLDALSAMSETESLRLQMAMDREAKFLTTLSDLLKKDSDTATEIVKNMK